MRAGGELRVVGLARNASPADLLWSALTLAPTVLGDRPHGGVVDPDVGLAEPTRGPSFNVPTGGVADGDAEEEVVVLDIEVDGLRRLLDG